jgi:predicted Zn-dependent protease
VPTLRTAFAIFARRRSAWTIAAILLVGFVIACATTPYTQRSQLILVSEGQETQLGADAYGEVLRKEPIVRDPALVGPVRRVGERIARVAAKQDYQREFNVIDDPRQVNAFALPGGKVAVYTGIFPVAQDEAGLAAVMGHEIAHALARHGAERMSQGVVAEALATGVAISLGNSNPVTRNAVMAAFGLGAQYGVLLPFGRSQESEADHIGLILMSKAGYDPQAALALWQRMEAGGGGSPPEYLSTHPSYDTRQQTIRGWLPEAQQYYQADPNLKVAALPPIRDR